MPNSPFRHKREYVPVSGALKKVRRAEMASNMRDINRVSTNSELESDTGTPTPITSGSTGVESDYDPINRMGVFPGP